MTDFVQSAGRRMTARLGILLAATLGAWTGPALAQVSPGPLSSAHTHLEGATHCLDCHASGAVSMNRRCRDCHREIDRQIELGRGLHGKESKIDCARCHPDHAGLDFDLIEWDEGDPDRFDHDRTGWALDGKHATLQCQDCHKPSLQKGEVVALLKRSERSRSWLGLSPNCIACHADEHGDGVDDGCRTCHTTRVWKPAPRFDHSRSAFPLEGRHLRTDCDKCHLVPGRVERIGLDGKRRPLFAPVPHPSCASCHADPHAGRLGEDCASCHQVDDFKKVSKQAFDHERTRYPLRGKHVDVSCASCHDPVKAGGKRPRFERCADCHVDAHAGQATLAGQRVDCASCHDLKGFRPSTYGVKRHEASRYPLVGRHRTVECRSCHRPPGDSAATAALGPAKVDLHPAHEKCRDCHADDHSGQLDRRADGGECASCHDPQGWLPSRFGVELHAETGFPLAGGHVETGCRSCHGEQRPNLRPLPSGIRLGKARVALTGIESSCRDCHVDPHEGRIGSPDDPTPEPGCLDCHTSSAFRPSTVDVERHRDFSFPLEAAHRAVPCLDCHRELASLAPEIDRLVVRGTPRDLSFAVQHENCVDCHESPHGDQFRDRPAGDRCNACHSSSRFAPAERFEHDRDAAFALRGAHARTPCADCHRKSTGADGEERVLYRPLSSECRSCHRGMRGSPDRGGSPSG